MAVYGNYEDEHYLSYLHCTTKSLPPFLNTFLIDPFFYQKSLFHSTKLHVAILVKRGKIVAQAHNKIASRTSGASSRGSQNFIHAEKNLIKHVKKSQLKGADIYVMRIAISFETKQVEFRYSQPCPECTVLMKKCMKEYGLKNVYFTK